MFFEDPAIQTYLGPILIVIQLIFLEGILSIDNAAVLGAMVSVLPDDQPVPYPKPSNSCSPSPTGSWACNKPPLSRWACWAPTWVVA